MDLTFFSPPPQTHIKPMRTPHTPKLFLPVNVHIILTEQRTANCTNNT